VYSPGWRNPYDLVLTTQDRMYAFDNGPNAGWGAVPLNCSNAIADGPSGTRNDQLHFVSGPGYYAGHANPTRANLANTFNASHPQSPITVPQSDRVHRGWIPTCRSARAATDAWRSSPTRPTASRSTRPPTSRARCSGNCS
jgi:hypothetical protein